MSHTHGIQNTQLLQTALNATNRAASTRSSTVSSEATSTPPANVSTSTASLSGTGTLLAGAGSEDIRAQKVAALKSAIEGGTYNVPAGDVADKLISSMLE